MPYCTNCGHQLTAESSSNQGYSANETKKSEIISRIVMIVLIAVTAIAVIKHPLNLGLVHFAKKFNFCNFK